MKIQIRHLRYFCGPSAGTIKKLPPFVDKVPCWWNVFPHFY